MWTTSNLYAMQRPKAGGILQLFEGLPGKPDGRTEYSTGKSEISFSMSSREDPQGHYPHTLYWRETPKPKEPGESLTLFTRTIRQCVFKNGIQTEYFFDRETVWRAY